VADDTITTVLTLDLEPYRKSLEALPKDTQKALAKLEKEAIRHAKKTAKLQSTLAKKAASEVSRHTREQAREAKRAARATERAYEEQFSSIMGLSNAAFGGVAGDVEDLAIVLGGISKPLAVIGVALGALAIGPVVLGGMAVAAKGLADSGAEALEELRAMGPAVEALVTPGAQANLDAYSDAMARLDLASSVAAAELGGALGPSLTLVADELLRIVPAAQLAGDALDVAKGAASTFYDVVYALSPAEAQATLDLINLAGAAALAATDTGELSDKIDDARQKAEDLADAAADEALFRQMDALGLTTAGYAQLTPEVEKATAEQKKAAQAQRDEAAAVAKATEELQSYGVVVHDTMGTTSDMVDFNNALTVSVEEVALTAEEKAENYAAAMAKMGDAMRGVQAIGGEAAAAMGQFAQLSVDAAGKEVRANRDRVKALSGTIQNLEKMREGATGDELRRIDNRISARKREQELAQKAAQRGRERALKSWRAAKAAQMSATVINSAAAMVAFLAPPPMGLGPVAGAVAAGIASVGMAASLATIAAQEPPKFHKGGIVAPPRQEVPAVLEAGEGVVRREAMMQPGAADTIRRMNEGGGPAPQPLAVYLNDRLVDTLMARAGRSDAQSRRGLAIVGTRTMYDRRR
jgi:hypothetical protein